jgi:hypothetical protein
MGNKLATSKASSLSLPEKNDEKNPKTIPESILTKSADLLENGNFIYKKLLEYGFIQRILMK